MGNCFGFLKHYKTKPNIYTSNAVAVPIGTPIYFDTSNNNTNNKINPNNPNVIIINQQPYYDNGLSTMNGFFSGMLMGEILTTDCL